VILQFQGKPVTTVQEFLSEVDRYKSGDRVTITVLRNDRRIDVPLTLEDTPRR
jgi:S1-C subfamily serine protease